MRVKVGPDGFGPYQLCGEKCWCDNIVNTNAPGLAHIGYLAEPVVLAISSAMAPTVASVCKQVGLCYNLLLRSAEPVLRYGSALQARSASPARPCLAKFQPLLALVSP